MINKADKNGAVVILHVCNTAEKIKFSLKGFYGKCNADFVTITEEILTEFFLCVCSVNDYIEEAE